MASSPLLLLLAATALLLPNHLCQSTTQDEEKRILLAIKQQLLDSSNSLHNWNSSTPLCSWNGIRCTTEPPTSVAELDFTSFNLNGTLPPLICELPNLTTLILPFNNFRQAFPLWISTCTKLNHLDISQNFFNGALPGNLSAMALPLQHLDLSYNEFTGPVPPSFGELYHGLEYLSLAGNRLTSLAPELGSLSNVTWINLSNNLYLNPARIPPELGRLSKLRYLNLQLCQLIGDIPPELGALKELEKLQLQNNNLSGRIPAELMFLPKLTMLVLYNNQLYGELPAEINNLASLTELDASQNYLSGRIPEEVSELKELRLLQLYNNELSGTLPRGLASLNHLETLAVFKNNLTGEIPELLGQNSSLTYVAMSRNKLTGALPPFLCNGKQLVNLSLYDNKLSGAIPESYGTCVSLQRFQMQGNNLQGAVPESVWSLPRMTTLNLASNKLSGSISPEIRGAARLNNLFLDDNGFEGNLPQEIGELTSLVSFSATGNNFTGSVPFGSCNSLESMNLSRNHLSGGLSDVGSCKELNVLDLSSNKISGSIPSALGNLHLNSLDLSHNQLSGTIPSSLGSLLLSSLDVSYNNLQGPVPGSLRASFPTSSFQGNPELCLNSCPISSTKNSKKKTNLRLILSVIIVAVVLVLILGVLGLCWQHHKMLKKYPHWKMKSFHRLSFDEMSVIEKLENMDERNIVGSGLTGRVYRVDLPNQQTVAVKELFRDVWQDAAFQAEIRALSSLRHRNIVKLLSCCSNRDTNLLIFEYMPNGSLGDHLHGKQVVNLDWNTRYKIALGAAHGLSYLHHDCFPAILHRDIKSNNILLSSDYEAKLADFGIAKLLETQTMTNVAGSYGYIAPEYAYTLRVNEKSDTYSFGVVLLELVTGKRPIESCFGECIDIVRWAASRAHYKGGQLEVLDCRLRDEPEQEQKMLKLLNVALLCTSTFPAARPSMRQIVEMLQAIEPQVEHFKIDTKTDSPGSSSSSSSPFAWD